jgi:hypothetical protein
MALPWRMQKSSEDEEYTTARESDEGEEANAIS